MIGYSYLELAFAIVKLALKDYRMAKSILAILPENKEALKEKKNIEEFFRSSFCENILEFSKELRDEVKKEGF